MTTRTRRMAAATGAAAFAGAAMVVFATPAADAAPVEETFEFTGAPEDFVVPEGVCEVDILAVGAQGGEGNGGSAPGLGGSGAVTLEVTPGETLIVRVGGAGQIGQGGFEDGAPEGDAAPEGLNGDAGGAGGFNGGGDGGGPAQDPGGGGGGASDVRQGGDDLSNRVVVGGGGGGGGGEDFDTAGEGGDGGGESGEDGGDSTDGTPGGGGGTQTAGGAAGDANATAGTAGQGGVGSDGGGGGKGGGGNDAGGGGGGGLFGGGGGAEDGFLNPNAAPEGDGDDGGGGGGGSGFGTTLEAGVQAGDGTVVITYDAEAGTCAPAAEVVQVTPAFTG